VWKKGGTENKNIHFKQNLGYNKLTKMNICKALVRLIVLYGRKALTIR
jgi:hypothetical protein